MNRRQKLVQQQFLNDEERVIKRLKSVYDQSMKDINGKLVNLDSSIAQLQKAYEDVGKDGIGDLAAAVLGSKAHYTPEEAKETLQSMIQSKVYQKTYQQGLQKQVGGILDKMHTQQFKTVTDYLETCYENGFIGTMFDLQGQGIPLCFPLDQERMVRAVQLDSKIVEGFYRRLGEDVAMLKKRITAEVSRGISSGMNYKQVAQQLASKTTIGYTNAVRIARTEGHRVQCQAGMDACYKAKDMGADVVKQWDATLDGRTRDSHAKLDGEIREIDDPFSNGLMYPGDPHGAAAEVINCRCALLERARWALGEAELRNLEKRAAFFGLDKAEQFDDYKKKYLQAAKEESKNAYDSAVVNPQVKTANYRNLYNDIGEPVGIQRTACERARTMLDHRSGTKYEDLTFIDSITGKHLTRNDYDVENEVIPSKRMMAMVRNSDPFTIIAIHNHSGNGVPSLVDIETAYKQKYKYGLIACHNGNVIKYEVTGEINSVNTDFLLDKANRILYNPSGFQPDKWQEVLDQLETENVRLKVFAL